MWGAAYFASQFSGNPHPGESPSQMELGNSSSALQAYIQKSGVEPADTRGVIIEIEKALIPRYSESNFEIFREAYAFLFNCLNSDDIEVRHFSSLVATKSVSFLAPFHTAEFIPLFSNLISTSSEPRKIVTLLDSISILYEHCTEDELSRISESLQPLLLYCASSQLEPIAISLGKWVCKRGRKVGDSLFLISFIRLLLIKKKSTETTNLDLQIAIGLAEPDFITESIQVSSDPTFFVKSLNVLPINTESGRVIISRYPNPHRFSFHHPSFPSISFFKVSYDVVLPFLKQFPDDFASLIGNPPESEQTLSDYLLCVLALIKKGFNPPIQLSALQNLHVLPHIRKAQIDCFAELVLRDKISKEETIEFFSSNLKDKTGFAICALENCIFHLPSAQLLNELMSIERYPPIAIHSLYRILVFIDYSLYPQSFKENSIRKIKDLIETPEISMQSIYLIQYLSEQFKACLFNSIIKELRVFDRSFLPDMFALSILLNNEQRATAETLIFLCQEVLRTDFVLEDTNSLVILIRIISAISQKIPTTSIPSSVVILPLLILRAECRFLYGAAEIVGIEDYFQASVLPDEDDLFDCIFNLISDATIETLISLRDASVECLSSFIQHTDKYDNGILDSIGQKLVVWPTPIIWNLLTSSAPSLALSVHGIWAKDPRVSLQAAIKCSEIIDMTSAKSSQIIQDLAFVLGTGPKREVSPSNLAKIDEFNVTFCKEFDSWLTGKWIVVVLRFHLSISSVQCLLETPFSQWEGPDEFWNKLPQFIQCVNSQRKSLLHPNLRKCDELHKAFVGRYSFLFSIKHRPGDRSFSGSVKKFADEVVNIDGLPDFGSAISIRAYRCELARIFGYSALDDLSSMEVQSDAYSSLYRASIAQLKFGVCSSCYSELIGLASELFCVVRPKQKQSQLFDAVVKQPFRGTAASLIRFTQRYSLPRCPIPDFDSDQFVFEHEMKSLIPMCLADEIRLSFGMKPKSPIVLSLAAPLLKESLKLCMQLDAVPHYSKSYLSDLKEIYRQFGISSYILSVLREWLLDSTIPIDGRESVFSFVTEILNQNDVHWAASLKTCLHKIVDERSEWKSRCQTLLYSEGDEQTKGQKTTV